MIQSDEDAVRRSDSKKTALAIRANAGEDCIDVVLKSKVPDAPFNNGFSKVNAHIHFVQFDVQASDGVNAGFNYEGSVRPFTVEGETLTAAAAQGDTQIAVNNSNRFQTGIVVGIGLTATSPSRPGASSP